MNNEGLMELFMDELDEAEKMYSKWNQWRFAIEAALLYVAMDGTKRWVFKGPDGKWWVR